MPSVETFIGVAPDSTGKKVRNLQIAALQADGTVATVMMQVVSIVDADGSSVRFGEDRDLQQQTLMELRAIRAGIQMLVEWLNPAASPVRTQPIPGGGLVCLPTPAVEEHELIEIAKDLRDEEDV